jgi:amino-acid N-acetyltransferase
MEARHELLIRPARKEELERLFGLFDQLELPRAGVQEHFSNFLVAERQGCVVGAVGLEIYDKVGLLRSLAVEPNEQGGGVGARLVDSILSKAKAEQLETVYLLTTTADRYFPRFGFETITRERMDPRLGASEELRGACPQSAVCMKLDLA